MRTITRHMFGLTVGWCALAGVSLTNVAHAFQADEAPAAATQPAPSDGANPLGVGEIGMLKAPGTDGVEIQIPGLGNLGMIPKLDFGLDLLYGQKSLAPEGTPEVERDDDGLRIRGSVRHRF